MNIHQEILREHSKSNVRKIAAYIGADEDRFAELMKLFLKGDYITTQRSAWVLSECAENHSFLVPPYFEAFINKLQELQVHDSVKRNIIRIWQEIEIPEVHAGEVYTICYNYLFSNEAIAIKVFSLTVCHRIARNIPELRTDLRYSVEDLLQRYENGSPAVKSRAKKILAELKKK